MSRPIRVLFLVDELRTLGGTERNLIRILPALPRERIEPSVITYDLNREEPAFATFRCPVEVYPLRRIYTLNGLRLAQRLGEYIRRNRIDVVHCFFESSDLWGAPAARRAGVRVIISSRRDMGIHRHRLHNLLYPLVSPLFSQVQAVSEEVRSWVIATDRLPPHRVVTVPNGIDLAAMESRETPAEVRRRYSLPADAPLVTTVGNLRRVKGQDIFLRAAGMLSQSHPDALFLIAGKELEADYVRSLRKEAPSHVRFLGPVEDVSSLLNASDVFVLPSRSEGMSTALLEAMACRLPAVATAVGGNPELVREGENGFLVSSEDPAALADRIDELLRHPELRERMGTAGRQKIETHFSLRAVIEQMTAEYERLFAASRNT